MSILKSFNDAWNLMAHGSLSPRRVEFQVLGLKRNITPKFVTHTHANLAYEWNQKDVNNLILMTEGALGLWIS